MNRARLFRTLCVVLMLGLFELSLRLAVRHESFVLKLYDDDNETFWRLWFVQRSRPRGSEVFYCHTYSPTRGWVLLPNLRDVHCMPTQPAAVVNTNGRGLRGLREFDYARQAGVKRIAVLGDSFTFGEEVSDEQSYCALLSQWEPDWEIMNFGVHGYGFDQMLICLREEVVRYRPDVVMLAFPYLDVARVRLALRDAPKPCFRLKNEQLVLRNSPVPRPEQVVAQEFYRLKMLDLVSLIGGRVRGESQRDSEARQITTGLLQAIAAEVREAGATPLFVYLPVREELHDRRPELSERERYLAQFCQARQIECLQLRPAFAGDGRKWKTEGHWSAVEHEVAARALRAKFRAMLTQGS
jgi:hypothetical protein